MSSFRFTSLFGLLGFLNVSNAGSTVFNWLMQIAGLAGFITWTSLNICHLAFMRALKARGISRDILPYKALWQPYFSYYGLFFNVLIIITNGFTAFVPWKTSEFFVAYISVIIFVVMFVGYKIVFKTKFVKSAEADLDSGRKEVEEMFFEEVVPVTWWGKFWAWMG